MYNFINLISFLVCMIICACQGFNIDVGTPLDFSSGSLGDQFGYTVALHQANNDFWALVGAPLSNNTGKLNQPFNGAVFRCKLNGPKSTCINLAVDDTAPKNWEDKTNQMMGATLISTGANQDIVACAPRFKDTPSNDVWLHGRCFFINGREFTVGAKNWNPCKGKSQGNRQFGYCQAGFSAMVTDKMVTKTGKKVQFIGAGVPGVQLGLGRFMIQLFDNVKKGEAQSSISISRADRLTFNNFMGYSAAYGNFSGSDFGDIAGGAPQGNKGKGKVIIYRLRDFLPIQAVIENTDFSMSAMEIIIEAYRFSLLPYKLHKRDNEMDNALRNIVYNGKKLTGSYFGSVICAVDLNRDGKSDLLIGAPLYAVNEDEGKVYVYMTDSKGAVNLKGTISGEGTIRGKFGSSIAAVGDLNGDGYQDVAVGAPYGGPDGKGAVYIYHGSKDGIGNNMQYVQKIYSANIPGNPTSFGHSISGNADADLNGYPDVVVGSFRESKVHFFKSRAVLRMTATLVLDRTNIALSNKSIATCKKDFQCVNATFCLTYTGKGTPSEIDLNIIMNLDKEQVGGKRAVVFNGAQKSSTVNSTRKYKIGVRSCHQQQIYIMENVKDLLSPIDIGVTFQYKEPSGGCSPGPCPIADMYAQNSLQKQITYLKDCGTDDICQSDLDVTATSILPKDYKELVFGLVDTYTVKIDLMNKGENAYLAKMSVDFPDDVSAVGVEFVNEPNPLWESEKFQNATGRVEFSMNNPFPSGHKLQVLVQFAPAKPRPRAKKLSFTAAVSTVSVETNTKNNRRTVTVDAALLADLTVSGSSDPPSVFYGKNKIEQLTNVSQVGPIVTYNFLVQNRGPSPVQEVHTQISLLTKHKSKWMAQLFGAKVDGSLACKIEDNKNPLKLKTPKPDESRRRKRRDTSGQEAVDLNCRTAACVTFNCYIGSLGKGESKKIVVETRIFQNTFIEEKRPLTKLSSVISILILGVEKDFLRQPKGHKPDEATVSVQVRPPVQIESRKAEPVAWWIILLAVLGALLLIVALVLIFWKFGFFERKLKGKKITGPTDDDDDYDNSM